MEEPFITNQRIATPRNTFRLFVTFIIIWIGIVFVVKFESLIKIIGAILILLAFYIALYCLFQSITIENSILIFRKLLGRDLKIDLEKIRSIRETKHEAYGSAERFLIFEFSGEKEKKKRVYMGLSLFNYKDVEKLFKGISEKYPHIKIIRGPETLYLS